MLDPKSNLPISETQSMTVDLINCASSSVTAVGQNGWYTGMGLPYPDVLRVVPYTDETFIHDISKITLSDPGCLTLGLTLFTRYVEFMIGVDSFPLTTPLSVLGGNIINYSSSDPALASLNTFDVETRRTWVYEVSY